MSLNLVHIVYSLTIDVCAGFSFEQVETDSAVDEATSSDS